MLAWQPEMKPRERFRYSEHESMKLKHDGLSERYVTELRKHLKRGPGGSLTPALALGREAVVRGLETLELARMHEGAISALKLSDSGDGLVKRAEIFFTEVISPIVENHRAARQNKLELGRLNETLGRRNAELAATNGQLRRGIVRRKRVEAALKKSAIDYARLLKNSLHLQEGLRQLTHRVLAAQEDERKKISHELQDEISQTLLGINVRLLSLKSEARTNSAGLKNEIASTQRLVAKSALTVRRAARKIGKP